ncbi:MAG: M23 family metallopeptidase [Myxococcota bacterium]
MERYSLIVMTGETAPVRRYEVRRDVVYRVLWALGITAALLLIGFADYVRLRVEHPELDALRIETASQAAQIDAFESRVATVGARLDQVRELERKVRIIANLPGSAGTGGAAVVEVGGAGGDLEAADRGQPAASRAGGGTVDPIPSARSRGPVLKAAPGEDHVSLLRREMLRLGVVANARETSLLDLIQKLEDKHNRLASSPAIWPTQGWLTSRFGNRISPFTGLRQFHSGIDIAGRRGSDVFSSARGRIKFAGKRGPLGNTVIIDHGFGVRTHYGHTDEILVKRGQQVERGQVIAALGSSGRSTGPHLHYSVEVNGKTVNPLNYIFN